MAYGLLYFKGSQLYLSAGAGIMDEAAIGLTAISEAEVLIFEMR